MPLTVNIATDNAAFENDPRAEIARILQDAASKITAGNDTGKLLDANGNTVGFFELTGTATTPEEENEDQDEAENICSNIEPLYDLGRRGDVAGLEAAFREYVTANSDDGCWVDPDNVDYDALAEFLES